MNSLTIIKRLAFPLYKQVNFSFSLDPLSKPPSELQQENVYKVYDKIAQHFSETRYKPWPRVANFLQHVKKGSIVADIGCGNGRNMGVNSGIETIGIDRCLPLLEIAQVRRQDKGILAADASRLPIRTESCDAFICIALLHHISAASMRQKIVSQLARVIRKGCEGLIYVRSMEILNNRQQKVRQASQQDFFVPWHLQVKYEKDVKKSIEQGHQYNPGKNSVIYQRYYHAFKQGELEDLVTKAKELEVRKSYYDRGNWACIVKKG